MLATSGVNIERKIWTCSVLIFHVVNHQVTDTEPHSVKDLNDDV